MIYKYVLLKLNNSVSLSNSIAILLKIRLAVDRTRVTEEARKGVYAGLLVINYNYLVATSLLSAVYGTYDDLSVVHVYIHDMCRHLYHDPSAAAYAGRGLILRSAHLSGYDRKSPSDPLYTRAYRVSISSCLSQCTILRPFS